MGGFFLGGMKPGSGFIPMKPVWNRYETGYETGPPDNRYETGMKPSPKTIFVGSRSETGYETGYETEPQNDLFEAGLKPGMKPQNSNQGFSGFLVGGVLQRQLGVVFLDQDRITIMLTPSSLQTMGRATAMKPRLKRQVCNWQV